MFGFLDRARALDVATKSVKALLVQFRTVGAAFPVDALDDPYVLGYVNGLAIHSVKSAGIDLSPRDELGVLEKTYFNVFGTTYKTAISRTQQCIERNDERYTAGANALGQCLDIIKNGVGNGAPQDVQLAVEAANKLGGPQERSAILHYRTTGEQTEIFRNVVSNAFSYFAFNVYVATRYGPQRAP